MQRTVTSAPRRASPKVARFDRGFKSRAEAMALGIREELTIGVADPFDPWSLAQRRGVRIIELRDLIGHGLPEEALPHFSRNSRVSAAYGHVDGEPFVLLFGSRASTRRLSDLTHELAHHELGHDATELFNFIGCRTWNPVQEAEAEWLAGCLLVPASGAIVLLKQGLSSADAAARFGVSTRMFSWRANMTGAFKRAASA